MSPTYILYSTMRILIYVILILLFIVTALLIHVSLSYVTNDVKTGGNDVQPMCNAMYAHAKSLPIGHIGAGITGGSHFMATDIKSHDDTYLESENVIQVQKNTFDMKVSSMKSKAKWEQYTSWDILKKHKDAVNSYIRDRNNVLKNPHLDWSKVLGMMTPKLFELYEYIGLINLEEDGKTLYVSELYRSDIKVGTIDSDTTFASIPSDMVNKVGKIPALFMFHTHPADINCCPLPSSPDLATAIYYASAGHYAASCIISRYGILLYGINEAMTKYFLQPYINKKDLIIARKNFTHDIVAAHESIRSWKAHTSRDYIDFYDRYRMFLYVYPSSEFIAYREKRTYDLLSPIDYEILEHHMAETQTGL